MFCFIEWLSLGFPVSEENLIIETGEGSLHSYAFGKKVMTHQVNPSASKRTIAVSAVADDVS